MSPWPRAIHFNHDDDDDDDDDGDDESGMCMCGTVCGSPCSSAWRPQH